MLVPRCYMGMLLKPVPPLWSSHLLSGRDGVEGGKPLSSFLPMKLLKTFPFSQLTPLLPQQPSTDVFLRGIQGTIPSKPHQILTQVLLAPHGRHTQSNFRGVRLQMLPRSWREGRAPQMQSSICLSSYAVEKQGRSHLYCVLLGHFWPHVQTQGGMSSKYGCYHFVDE